DQIVGDQLVELGEVLLRHRLHALPVEVDDRLPVACHTFLLFTCVSTLLCRSIPRNQTCADAEAAPFWSGTGGCSRGASLWLSPLFLHQSLLVGSAIERW